MTESIADRLKKAGFKPVHRPCVQCGKNVLPGQIRCLQCQLADVDDVVSDEDRQNFNKEN